MIGQERPVPGSVAPFVRCLACNGEKDLSQFRPMPTQMPRYSDFCARCESTIGPQVLYRDHVSRMDPMVRRVYLHSDGAAEAQVDADRAKEEVEAELARRELCRRRLIAFVMRFMPGYKPGWVHHDICRRLEKFMYAVERGESPNLMLFVPPRHGKSTLASDFFPSWALGHHPEWEFIATAYAQSLPVDFSRNIRDRLQSDDYKAIFPGTQLRKDSTNVEQWKTTAKGMFCTAGVGGSITGKGAHILLIDDPVKDYEEAMSPTMRENAYNWFVTTSNTRLAPGGGKLLIMTRWHDMDLAGRILDEQRKALEADVSPDEMDRWEVVEYPAIAEQNEYLLEDGSIVAAMEEPDNVKRVLRLKGEALHPARYDIKQLLKKRNGMPPQSWSSLYQQRPVPDDGEFFKKDYFRLEHVLGRPVDEYRLFLVGDLASSTKKLRDYTVMGVFAMDFAGDLHLIDLIRARMAHKQVVEAIVNMVVKYNLDTVGLENGKEKLAVLPYVEEELRKLKRSVWFDEDLQPITDKITRAKPAQGYMQQGRIWFLNSQPWYSAVEHELLRFPNGAHDDIVDVIAWAVRMAQRITPPKPKYQTRRKQNESKSWREQLPRQSRGKKSFMAA